MIKAISYFGFLFALLLFFVQCDTTEPPNNKQNINLELEDVSCTEAWITLTTTNLHLPTTVTLLQNGDTRNTINLTSNDSLLYIDSLLPNQSYTFQSIIQSYNHSSNELSVTTLDTTSHNFTFETFTFGGTAGSSMLYDVAIINEEYIIAVGSVFLTDSLGLPDPQPYGLAIWDGQSWELKKIFHSTNIPVTPRGIFVISPTEIYLASGSIFKWDGSSSTVQLVYSRQNLPDPNATIEKLWGSSASSIYGAGNVGSIMHNNGTIWQRIESGTTTDINDVWGIVDKDGFEKIYCAVSFVFQTGDQKILTIKNNNVDSLDWNTGRRVHSVWTNSKNYVYAAGGGIFENRKGYWNEITQVPLYYSRNIRGDGTNNIFDCGDYGLFAHFNGSTWKTYNELYIQGIYFSVAVKNNIVISVGLEGSKAIIIKGIRN